MFVEFNYLVKFPSAGNTSVQFQPITSELPTIRSTRLVLEIPSIFVTSCNYISFIKFNKFNKEDRIKKTVKYLNVL